MSNFVQPITFAMTHIAHIPANHPMKLHEPLHSVIASAQTWPRVRLSFIVLVPYVRVYLVVLNLVLISKNLADL
jgi:hypothetical protein